MFLSRYPADGASATLPPVMRFRSESVTPASEEMAFTVIPRVVRQGLITFPWPTLAAIIRIG
jgi:hypothetical protein